jgi:hypothetical protein
MMFLIKPTRTVRPGYWFAQKRYGFGAVPATKQGWAVTIACALALGMIMLWMPGKAARDGAALALLACFAVLCWKKTDGGWRWRWGGRD